MTWYPGPIRLHPICQPWPEDDAYIKACDRFIYTEIFRTKAVSDSKATKAVGASKAAKAAKPGPLRNLATDAGFKAALDQSVEAATEGGRAHLGAVGSHLIKLLPDFDARNYGFRKLSDLVEKVPTLKLVRVIPTAFSGDR
jgi:hypothetical protein